MYFCKVIKLKKMTQYSQNKVTGTSKDSLISDIYIMDCIEGMKQYPDKYFDLGVCDPEYGIGISSNPIRQKHKKKEWDNSILSEEYFKELFRVSKNQIIWGGNYFIDYLKKTQSYIIWDKKQPEDFSLAMCEFAWCSIQKPAKIFRYSVQIEQNKIHPTQKPVALYKWLLTNYAKQGDKILDSHLGSASSRIAAYDLNFDFTGFELDPEYIEKSTIRFNNHINQLTLF